MPFQEECHCVTVTPAGVRLIGVARDLDDTPGFVIAPFTPDDATPIILIESENADCYESAEAIPADVLAALDAACSGNDTVGDTDSPGRGAYSRDFARFHSRLVDGTFGKLVLSRRKTVRLAESPSPTALFADACARYPRCFIALFSTPSSGTWLVATPELLIERRGVECHTMALAGTMEYIGDPDPRWSGKNIREQQCVADYIREAITPYAADITVDGPHTVLAAGLVHLRSDFSFRLSDSCHLGGIIDALHPTPAVCGLPAAEARDFIVGSEHSGRAYYSGFCGPVGIGGRTALFVTLRCMRLRSGACDLFAGGGLLADSTEASEWEETEAKMKTMHNLLSSNEKLKMKN